MMYFFDPTQCDFYFIFKIRFKGIFKHFTITSLCKYNLYYFVNVRALGSGSYLERKVY